MSLFETQEQRQIRQLRNKIRYMESQQQSRKKENKELNRLIQQARDELAAVSREFAAKIREHQEQAQKMKDKITGQSETIRNLDAMLKERNRIQNEKIRQMQRQHERDVKEMQAGFKEATGKLRDSIASTRREMQEGFVRITAETDAKIEASRKETDGKIAALNQELSGKIRRVDETMSAFIMECHTRENGEKELAAYWSEQVIRLYNELVENYRPQLFAPKEMERLRIRIDAIQSDLAGGRYTSAADGGRIAFYEAMDLKEELIAAEMEWNYWFQALKEREIELLEMMQACENREYELDYEGEKIVDTNGIDYWTGGQLSIIRDRIQEFRQSVADAAEQNTEFIRDRVTAAQGLLEELVLVENAAHTNVAMALSRMEMAAKIGAILGESYQMIEGDGDYFGEENREEYHALFENPVTGDQAAVVVTPVMGNDGTVTNYIELIVGNADNNPITREKMNEAVAAKLREGGITDASFPCSGKYGSKTGEECRRVGNIEAVAAGDEAVRADV